MSLPLLGQAACAHLELRDTTSPSLWRLSSPHGKGSAYLLGSVHAGPEQGWRYPPTLVRAFDESDTLVVEYDLITTTSSELFKRGMLPPDRSLTDLLSNETWAQTRPLLERFGIPEVDALKMKPWLIALLLGGAAVDRLGYDFEHGVDMHFLKRAHAQQAKSIVELESLKSQIDMFDNLSPSLQELMLRDVLLSTPELANFLSQLMDSWRSGDEERMTELFLASSLGNPDLVPFYDIVLTQRNVNMSDRIASMIQAGGTHFVVVGALHVIGDEGIVSSLARRGFTVERIDTY